LQIFTLKPVSTGRKEIIMEMVKYPVYTGRGNRIETYEDLLHQIPYDEKWEGCAGYSRAALLVNAVFQDGGKKELECQSIYRHASNHDPDQVGGEPPTIGEQIASLDVTGLEVTVISECTYRDDDNDFRDEWYVPVKPLDVKRIRRRVEDRLRKLNDPQTICNLALQLGCKITD
jgi:hypothetical protein